MNSKLKNEIIQFAIVFVLHIVISYIIPTAIYFILLFVISKQEAFAIAAPIGMILFVLTASHIITGIDYEKEN